MIEFLKNNQKNMNVILMTVLLTLLGVGIVTLLVWLLVTSGRLIKYKKSSNEHLNNLDQCIQYL